MFETVAFKTRARTIDHIGREQIADCPTAVSELWKNAYDAYALNLLNRLSGALSRIGLDFISLESNQTSDGQADA